jgi:hypothetical protein
MAENLLHLMHYQWHFASNFFHKSGFVAQETKKSVREQ